MRERRWLLVGGVLAVIGTHVLLGALAVPHATLSATVITAVVGVAVIAHLGVLAPLSRRKRRGPPP